jgi:peptide/nickel transport system substrate-binding protein
MKNFFALLLSIMPLLACSTREPGPKTERSADATLIYGIPQAPVSLDPAIATDLVYYQIVFNLFETLISIDWETGEFVPALATSWQADSPGFCWTLSLRPNVFFHDGTPFNAEAVKISLERQFDPASPYFRSGVTDTYGHFAFSRLEEIRVVDDLTVQFILKNPYPAFLDNLATPNFAAIISPGALEKSGENFGHQPVGTGPFQFERWEGDEKIVIKKFQQYWGKLPQIDGVVYKIIPGLETKIKKLREGKLDVISGLSVASAHPLHYAPGIRVIGKALIGTTFLGFNCRAHPFSDANVRRAVAQALDRRSLVNAISRGFAEIANGPLPPLVGGYKASSAFSHYQPQAAQRLLESFGYRNNAVIELHHFIETDSLRADPFVQACKTYLEKIGLQVKLVPYHDWQAYRQTVLVGGQGQLFWDGWMSYTRDPGNFLYPLFHSQSSHNFFHYKNPQVDELLDQARQMPDVEQQRLLYEKVQEIILWEVPAVFISHPKAVYAIRDRVKNFTVDPLAIPRLHEVRLE